MQQYLIALASCVLAAAAWAQPPGATARLVQEGAYLARAGDCIGCHSARGGKPFAGGLAIETPIGTIYSTNITPDEADGIGSYSYADFDRALRHGVARGGQTLYPAMPYTAYAQMRPSDVRALYAYFRHGVAPVARPNRAPDIPWPLSMRWPLRFWRLLFAPDVVTEDTPPPAVDDSVARGRYLVVGPGHCGACHTPRGFALQEKARTDADGSAFLSGGVVDGWFANNLRGDLDDGLGRWSRKDIVEFLQSGRNAHTAAFGSMRDVVQESLQYLTDADLDAIAAYLKTLGPVRPDAVPRADDGATARALRAAGDRSAGALLFANHCAACHRTDGQGYAYTFPQLALSATVNTADPTSLIRIVLQGAEMPSTHAAPTPYGMPGFAAQLTDRDVAAVASFVRSKWGNRAAAVDTAEVARLRRALGAAPAPRR